ncbi:hypothetical protein ABK040_007811 [Willaertia magna]
MSNEDDDILEIEKKNIDVSQGTYWERIERLYTLCEDAVDSGTIDDTKAGNFEDFANYLIKLFVPLSSKPEQLVKLFYVTQLTLEIFVDRDRCGEEDIVDLEKQVEKLRKELEIEMRNHRTTKSTNESLMDKTASLERNLKEANDKVKRFQEEINELSLQNKDLDYRLKSDKDQTIKSKKGMERVQEERDSLLYEVKTLDEKLRNTIKVLEKKNSEIEKLNESITNYERESQESRILQKELGKTISELTQQNKTLQSSITALEQDLEKEKKNAINALNAMNDQFKVFSNSKENEIQELHMVVNKIDIDLNNTKDAYEKALLDLIDNNKRIEELDFVIQQKDLELGRLEEELKNTSKSPPTPPIEKNERIETPKLESELVTTVDNKYLVELENQIKTLNESLRENEKEKQQFQLKNDELIKLISERDNELTTIRAKLSDFEKGVSGLDIALKEIRYLREQLALRDKDIEQYKIQLNVYFNKLNDLAEENIFLRRKLGMEKNSDLRQYLKFTTEEKEIQTDEDNTLLIIIQEKDSKIAILKKKLKEKNEVIKDLNEKLLALEQLRLKYNEHLELVQQKLLENEQTITEKDKIISDYADREARYKAKIAELLNKKPIEIQYDDRETQTILFVDNTINNQIKELLDRLKEKDDEIFKLKAYISQLEENHSKVMEELIVLKEFVEEQLREYSEKTEVCIKKLNSELEEANIQIEILTNTLQQSNNKMNRLKQEKERSDEENTMLRNTIHEKDMEISHLLHLIETYKSSQKILQLDMEEKIERLNELTRIKLKLEQKILSLESKVKELMTKLEKAKEEHSLLKEKEALISRLMEEKQQLIQEFEVDNETTSRFVENMKKTIQHLHEIIEQKDESVTTYEQKILFLREEHLKDLCNSQQEITKLQQKLNDENKVLLDNLRKNIDKIENQGDPEIPPEPGIKLEDVEEMISSKANEIKELDEKVHQLSEELNLKDVMLQEALKAFDNMKIKLDLEINDYKNQISELEEELNKATNSNQKLKEQFTENHLLKRIGSQQKKLDKLNQQKDNLEQTVNKLSQSLVKAEQMAVAKEKHQNNVDKYEVEKLKKKEEKLKERLEDRIKTSVDQEKYLMLQKENTRLKTKVEDLSTKQQANDKEKLELSTKISDLLKDIEELKKEIQESIKTRNKLKSDLEKLSKENEELKKEKQFNLDLLDKHKKQNSSQLNKIAKKLAEAQDDRDRIKQECTNLKMEITEIRNEKEIEAKQMLEKLKQESNQKLSTVNEEIENLKREKENMRNEIERLKIENSELKNFTKEGKLLQQSSKKESTIVMELEEIKKERDLLRRDVNLLIKENDDLKQTNQILENNRKVNSQNNTDKTKKMTKDLKETTEERDKLLKEKDDLKAQLEEIQKSVRFKSQQFFEKQQQEMSLKLTKALREAEESSKEKIKLQQELKVIMKENEELKSELNAFDPEFFEEIEDLKYNYVEAVKLNKIFRKKLEELGVNIEEEDNEKPQR